MFGKNKKGKFNFWGDESPEKLGQAEASPSTTKQLTDIVNPVKLLDSIFAQNPRESVKSNLEHKSPKRQNETLIFSFKTTHEDRQIKEETAQILQELKKQVTVLQKSEKALTAEIAKVKVTELPPQAGIYYLRYFEWLISVIRGIRIKVDQGRAWLAAFNQKSAKKAGYWKRYKKHGTTFGLSQERSLSTQTG